MEAKDMILICKALSDTNRLEIVRMLSDDSFLWHNTHSIISSFSRYISGALHIIHSSFISYLPKASTNELASLITFLFRE